MKLRIKGDSIRLRLTQHEVLQLAASGRVTARTRFGPDRQLRYQVATADQLSGPVASFDADTIEVTLSRAAVERWAGGNEVSLHGEQRCGDNALLILVEKDFQCLQPRPDEDEQDMFPHPKAP